MKSKLVNFFISSGSHPGKVNAKNAWIVENLHLPSNKIDNAEIKNKWPHLKRRKSRLFSYERHFNPNRCRHANSPYRSRN